MRASRRRPTLSAVRSRRRSGPEAVHARPRPDQPEAGADELRARSSGGPEDKALYSCECGCSFQARVSASVRCPHCGAAQAW